MLCSFAYLQLIGICLVEDEGLAVGAPLDPVSHVVGHVSPDGIVALGREQLSGPDQDRPVGRAGGQELAVVGEVHVLDWPGVALQAGHQPGVGKVGLLVAGLLLKLLGLFAGAVGLGRLLLLRRLLLHLKPFLSYSTTTTNQDQQV